MSDADASFFLMGKASSSAAVVECISVIDNKFEYISSDSFVFTNAYTASQKTCNERPWISNQYSCHAIHRQPDTHTHTNKKDHPFLAFFVCPSYTHSNINPIRAAHGSATVSKSADERRQMAELY